jgi:replicative DNA helicase Mcm
VRKGVGIIVVSNRTDCERLRDALSDYSGKMEWKTGPRLRNISGASEKLPRSLVSERFTATFRSVPRSGLIENGLWATIYEYMHERRQPSVGQVLKIASKAPGISSVQRSDLKDLAEKNYFLDEIMAIESEEYSGYVYDIMMKEHNNFVAEGVISHNCIDEFDKMRAEDRSALHEQMEQQVVTIAKGGIYASLNARTAILGAMNPVLGKYNPFQNLTDNIGDIPVPLLTRFDLIFVIKDQPSLGEDEKLAAHILTVHSRKTYTKPPPVEFGLLKKYIAYAKKGTPSLTKEANDRIKEYYLELRKSGGEEGQIPPTPRTLESLIRLATARAKLLLKEQVDEEDALAAIALMNRMVQDVLTDAKSKKTDFGIQYGRPVGVSKNVARAMEVFKSIEGESKLVSRKLFKEELISAKFTDEEAEEAIRNAFRVGLIYEAKPGVFKRMGV